MSRRHKRENNLVHTETHSALLKMARESAPKTIKLRDNTDYY